MTDIARMLVTAVASAWLGGCGSVPQPLLPADGADPEAAAILAIDHRHPVSIRALDGAAVPFRLPSVIGNTAFAVAPGQHRLWASSAGWPGIPVPVAISCYSIDVMLLPGVRYLLREDEAQQRLLLLREGSEQPEAIGRLVDRPLLPFRDCRWQSPEPGTDSPDR